MSGLYADFWVAINYLQVAVTNEKCRAFELTVTKVPLVINHYLIRNYNLFRAQLLLFILFATRN